MALQWFKYNSGNASDPASYTKHGATAPTDCSTPTQQLCAIRAEEDTNAKPIIDNTILIEMVNALQAESNKPGFVLLKPR
ncbi:hypothetical protein [Sphingobacterium tabacisoli]|uniref:Uncharacterized protein n=1 Tax=Sphingobacterium tabacisoli TaxID=2044855 RepID=A0ABW5KWU5_9SPHI|nr:hypothetical protein [Sphingobacterium tabacisoli]